MQWIYPWHTSQHRRPFKLFFSERLIEEGFEDRAFERLLFDQAFADHNQARLVLLQNAISFIEGRLDNAAYLFIDLARGLLTIIALLAEVPAKKDQLFFVTQCHRANQTAHAVFSNHRAG